MSASATAHLVMLMYTLPLVHRPKGVLLVYGDVGDRAAARLKGHIWWPEKRSEL